MTDYLFYQSPSRYLYGKEAAFVFLPISNCGARMAVEMKLNSGEQQNLSVITHILFMHGKREKKKTLKKNHLVKLIQDERQ